MSRKTDGETLPPEVKALKQLGTELEALQTMGLRDLRARFEELFGVQPKSKNLPFLRKQIAYRIQERREGGLSPEARERLEEILPEALPEPRTPKSTVTDKIDGARDLRLPVPRTVLTRVYKGVEHLVEVQTQDFRYRGRTYTSLSTIAKEITGTSWNGFTFFRLGKERQRG